ncbi:DUF6048 family protein [Riemerella anatipestifer]|nr:DUF6048 family protein [Riemerella anatipestifer]MDY3324817.1 DUF6048 family protein [Riemerella anatipestifer]MDY3353627.1 DUF6048 family protein [Riemerella anatipestifer]
MKIKPIFILFFSVFFLSLSAQDKDSLKTKWKYQPNAIVGANVLGAGLSVFSKQKNIQFFVSSEIKGRLNGIVEGGYAQNIYDKNAYNATTSGIFGKLGAFYMMVTDAEDHRNGFYAGGKLATAFYQQTYLAIPTKGSLGQVFTTSLPTSKQSSYWVEATVGGRVRLFNSNFFIDVNAQPKYLLYTTKQDGVFPMIVPGFGRSSGKFNMGFAWNLAYYF